MQFNDQPIGVFEVRSGEVDRRFQIENDASHGPLCLADSNLLHESIGYGYDLHPFSGEARRGAHDVEEQTVRIIEVIGTNVEFFVRFHFHRDACHVA